MSVLTDLIAQISDPNLRERIAKEADKLVRDKKFGLVFESHLPECTPLYGLPLQVGTLVALNNSGKLGVPAYIRSISDDMAHCEERETGQEFDAALSDLAAIAQFGDPIYPSLTPIASVCNAPDSELWHTLIEADNYHALQLLQYLYAGQVDCIYIDPPYNTGARDWKYNNDYVDNNDQYRHSKWLSFMERRLKLAKKLLNPTDSVLIVTIDEKEYLHLGMLLDEVFPEARIQKVSVAIHASGVARSEFSRNDEYYFFVMIGKACPKALELPEEWNAGVSNRQKAVRWESMLRSGNNGRRIDRPNLFFPVLFSPITKSVTGFGEPVPVNVAGKDYVPPQNTVAVLPYASDGSEACWRISATKAKELQKIGAFDWGEYKGSNTALKYLKPGELEKIERGEYKVIGHKENGAMIISSDDYMPKWIPGTQWNVPSHQAGGTGGSMLIKALLGEKRFDFPKSMYAVRDSVKFFVAHKPHALIVDFFAGSGTTLHAVNLLNAEDGGQRRCILVTNNEVSADEAKAFKAQGLHPGDEEWEAHGIARYVTWPRTVCSIEGHDVNGEPLKGTYLGSERPMAEGFKANAAYFKLGFLNKNAVALGRQFRELLPLLWLKAGARGPCPQLAEKQLPEYLLLPENHLAILIDEGGCHDLYETLSGRSDIDTLFVITNSESRFLNIKVLLNIPTAYQLYRDYLDNFRLICER